MSARSARQHKAWGAASAATKPQDYSKKIVSPRGTGERHRLANEASDDSAVARFAGCGLIAIVILGLTPPGFMPSCAPRTVVLKNRRIAG
jgi:hypothetical protein